MFCLPGGSTFGKGIELNVSLFLRQKRRHISCRKIIILFAFQGLVFAILSEPPVNVMGRGDAMGHEVKEIDANLVFLIHCLHDRCVHRGML